jgi:glutaredoxin-like YruB-family protein
MTVKVYITPACPYCYTLKEFLKENKIEFVEVDVSQDEKTKEELIKKSGKMEVPVLEVDGQIVAGFDKEKIVKLLKIKE